MTVDVWLTFTALPSADVGALARVLNDEERRRARACAFERDRTRYIVAHGFMRAVLALYTRVAPEQVEFDLGTAGKPFLRGGSDPLHFNLSHSGDLAVVAVSPLTPIGVDVELVRPISDLEGLVKTALGPHEHRYFLSQYPGDRLEAFFRLWTRKEAYWKAGGIASDIDPADLDVELIATRRAGECSEQVAREPQPAPSVQDISPAPGYVGAIAGSWQAFPIRERWWEPSIADRPVHAPRRECAILGRAV